MILWTFYWCGLQEGNKIFSGGADNAGRMFDVTTGQATQVAQHDAPIKVVKWVDAPQAGILATGSWDKTIKVRFDLCFLRLVRLNIRPSIGTCEHRPQLPLWLYQNDAIPSMCNILLWLLGQPNVTSRYSTSQIQTPPTRQVVASIVLFIWLILDV